jgi:hypothetical protein
MAHGEPRANEGLQMQRSYEQSARPCTPASTPRLLASLLLILLLSINIHTLDNYLTDPIYAKAPPWQLYHDYVSDNARPGDVMLTNFRGGSQLLQP